LGAEDIDSRKPRLESQFFNALPMLLIPTIAAASKAYLAPHSYYKPTDIDALHTRYNLNSKDSKNQWTAAQRCTWSAWIVVRRDLGRKDSRICEPRCDCGQVRERRYMDFDGHNLGDDESKSY
jgi:hypothetical protein